MQKRVFAALALPVCLAAAGCNGTPPAPVQSTAQAFATQAVPTVSALETRIASSASAAQTSVAPTVNAAQTSVSAAQTSVVPTVNAAVSAVETNVVPTVNAAVSAEQTRVAPTVSAAVGAVQTNVVPTVSAVATTQVQPTAAALARQVQPTVSAAATQGPAQAATEVAQVPVRIDGAQLSPTDPTLTLRNTSNQALDLSAWTLRVANQEIGLPDNARVAAGQALVVHAVGGNSAGNNIYLGSAAQSAFTALRPGASIALENPSGATVSSFTVPGA